MASVLAAGTFASKVASAQQLNATAQGMVGGGLLGAEAGTIVESMVGVQNPLIYVVSDIVLAAGGAVGGYEVNKTSSDGRAPVFMLVGGLGLAIPAIVLTLNAWEEKSEYASEDRAPVNQPTANPGTPGNNIVGPSNSSAPASGGSTGGKPTSQLSPVRRRSEGAVHLTLVDVNGSGVHLGVPVPEVRPTFTLAEIKEYGLAQQTEVRMPLVKVAF